MMSRYVLLSPGTKLMTKTKLLESTSIACTELLTENCVLTHVSQVKRTELNFFLLSSTLLHAHSIYLSIGRVIPEPF
jgi:hypothetical protein